jgi:hypothetical protein
MALTKSNPFKIGKQAPSFNLLDTTSDIKRSLYDLKDKMVL